jgi:ribosomal-protein-serine acetyltransferase
MEQNESRFFFHIDTETELRLFTEEDAEELFALIDCNRAHLRQWLPWVDYEVSTEDSREFIEQSLDQYERNKGFQLGIYYRGRLAGVIGMHSVNWPNKKVEIGYWQGEQFQGRGLMTSACRTLIDYAFDRLQLNRVEILCATGNVRSCAIPQRLGFTREGVLRDGEWLYDHYVDLTIYGMLGREWSKFS